MPLSIIVLYYILWFYSLCGGRTCGRERNVNSEMYPVLMAFPHVTTKIFEDSLLIQYASLDKI